jgi:hypothetical protein
VRSSAPRKWLALPALALLATAGWALFTPAAPQTPLATPAPVTQSAQNTAYVACDLSDEDTIAVSAAVASVGHLGVLLFDKNPGNNLGKFADAFLHSYGPDRLISIHPKMAGSLEIASIPSPYGTVRRTVSESPWQVQKRIYTGANAAVVADARDRRCLLQAACLAGALHLPLRVVADAANTRVSEDLLVANPTNKGDDVLPPPTEVYAVGRTGSIFAKSTNLRVHNLPDEAAVTAAYAKALLKSGPIQTIVLANPTDHHTMSTLAPWIAIQKHAALVLTDDKGTNAESVINAAIKSPTLARVENLIIAADLQAIPMIKRPNPIDGRDAEIEMEPMTADGDNPCSFAVGRLFHPDRNVIALMLARERLLEKVKTPKALIVSNPGGGLPLLETFSRHTANEFKNAGYHTTAYFGHTVERGVVRKVLPEANIFLWEGHHSTLVSTFGIHQWEEPMEPSLVFLQSCLALAEPKAQPFLERGAVGVIGSSTRTYSGSGGAFALAFFDSLLYEDQSLGASLRHAKNFMLAFVELKKRRFGEESKLSGANVRSAWAFTLWGDPTLKMPHAAVADDALEAVHHVVKGNAIVLTLPSESHDAINSPRYQAVVPANARLAGLVRKQDMTDQHKLVPFVFAEVQLSQAKAGKTPKLKTRLPETHWAFCYDERLQRGYLLVTPRSKDAGELRFQIDWE